MSNKSVWLSTTICRILVNCTFTVLGDQVDSVARVWRSVSDLGKPKKKTKRVLCLDFVKNDDIRILRDIEQYYATQIDEMPMNVADLI